MIFGWLALAAMSVSFLSCVGTVEDKNPSTTKGASAQTSPLYFDGIFKATAITNDKVEIFFYPAVGDPRLFTYLVYYDGGSQPISVPGATLRTDYRGLLKTTVTGLQTGTNYSFNVQVVDSTGNRSTSTLVQTTKTFSNLTANFPGVSIVRNLSGADGRNALRVEWPAAERIGSIFSPKEIDPSQYEISVINADELTPDSFDDTSIGEPNRKVIYVSDNKIAHNVDGLKAGTKYYIRVRCMHFGYSKNGANSSYKREENSNYFLAQTLSDQIGDIDVDLSLYNVDSAPGAAGLSSFNVSWDPARAAFSEYRVYYRKMSEGVAWSSYRLGRDDNCNGVETNDPAWSCKKVSYSVSSTPITDLEPYTNYEVVTVICGNSTCSFADSVDYYHNSPYRTDPGTAAFGGIEEIFPARNYWALDEVYLKYTPPDLSSGVIDGLIVRIKTSTETKDLNNPDPAASNTSSYSVSVFDFAIDNEVTVKGIDAFSGQNYCFNLLPYVWDNGVVDIKTDNVVEKCITPAITMPLVVEFPGLKLDSISPDTVANSIVLSWDTPLGGIYNQFTIFVRITPGVFSFGEAINPTDPNYVSVNVPYGENSYSINFLPEGVYQFGVLSNYDVTGGYSVFNENIYEFNTL